MSTELETSYKIEYPDKGDNELTLHGSVELTREAVEAFAGSDCLPGAKVSVDPDNETATIIIKGTSKELVAALRLLYENELIECDHEFTESVSVDDTRWFGSDGEVHARSNPDAERCLICGKYYNPVEEDWQSE